ncbi:RNA polymerase sigma factor [Pedobacter sp. AW1-32]|uniref:RNA polymerase sigma factor n=1 Tax=Pedobacter sp. AW1-32 TaxID=3383026 RepID=UPI003FEDBBEA
MLSPDQLSESALIALLKQGNEDAFAEIYNRFWEKMASYAVRLTKSEEEAADIVQEIFISLWKKREALQIKTNLQAYLIGSTRNLSLRFIERNIQTENFEEKLNDQLEDFSQNIEEHISFADLQRQVDKAIAKMPKKMREVYLLSRDEQMSYRQIAEQLDIAEGTVKKQISNALKILSENLSGLPILFVLSFFDRFK